MKKKLLLLMATLVVLLAGLWVYRSLLGSDFVQGESTRQDEMIDITVDPGSVGSLSIAASDRPTWMAVTDPDTGRRQAVFKAAARSEREGLQLLDRPEIEIYLDGGGTLRITAASATLEVTEVGTGVVPRRGQLRGGVTIQLLRPRGSDAAAAGPDESLRIVTEEMDFDNELQEIVAAGAVAVHSPQFELFGEDLLLQWNTAPNELRLLRLAHGERLVYLGGAELPSDEAASNGASAETSLATPPMPATSAAPATPAAAEAPQHYLLTLSDHVRLESERQSIHGAQRVSIVTTLASRGRGGLSSFSGGEGGSRRAGSARRQGASSTDAVAVTGDRDASDASALAAARAVLTWDGPLVIRPLRPEDEVVLPPPGQYRVRADGEEMLLQRDQARVDCTAASYLSHQRRVELEGRPDRPVRVDLGDGRRLSGQRVVLDDARGALGVEGPGAFEFSAAGLDDFAGELEDAGEVSGANDELVSHRIDWHEGVTLSYERVEAADGRQGLRVKRCEFRGDVVYASADADLQADAMELHFIPAPPRDGEAERDLNFEKLLARSVIATGNVRLTQALTGDEVSADVLTLDLGVDERGRQIPTLAHARGRVEASHGPSTIHGDYLELRFLAGEDADGGRSVRPSTLMALGEVRLNARPGKGGDNEGEGAMLEVFAHRLDSDLLSGVHTLVGDESRARSEVTLVRGRDRLYGRRVIVTTGEDAQLARAEMPGAGRAELLMTTDLQGEAIPQARPALVRWDDGMSYDAASLILNFAGEVRMDSVEDVVADPFTLAELDFDSSGDHLRCERMEVLLLPPSQRTARASDRIASIRALGEVAMLRRWEAEGRLLGRVKLAGPEMLLDQLAREFSVIGPGTLGLEDYRAADAADASAGGYADMIAPPVQTAFAWTTKLRLFRVGGVGDRSLAEGAAALQGSWTALLSGAVVMRQRSGDKIIAGEGLTQAAARTPGRVRSLDCRTLLVSFAGRAAEDKADADAPGGLSLALELFEALGEVVMVDGDYELHGGRVVFDAVDARAVVTGDEEGVGLSDAHVYYRGAVGAYGVSSPRVMLRRQGRQYEVHALGASGGGR